MSEDEDRLIGQYVRLKKREALFSREMESYIGTGDSKFLKALTKQFGSDHQDTDRIFKAEMSVDPDSLQRLVDEFRKVRMEYKEAYEAFRTFEKAHPQIAKDYC